MTDTTSKIPTSLSETVPAKLLRSTFIVGLVLLVFGLVFAGSYAENHSVLQAMQMQATPSVSTSISLGHDFQTMDHELAAAVGQISNADKSTSETATAPADHFDYQSWVAQTASDVEAATHINPPGGLLVYKVAGLPNLVDCSELYQQGFYDYREDVDLARADLRARDLKAARAEFADSERVLSTEVYPAVQALYDSGLAGLQNADSDYQGSLTILNDALVVAGFLLFGVILWQYWYILTNCKIVLQGTLLTILFGATAAGSIHYGYKSLNSHLNKAFAESYSTMAGVKFELVTATPDVAKPVVASSISSVAEVKAPKADTPKVVLQVAKPVVKAAAPTGVVEPKAEPPKAVPDVAKHEVKAAVQAAAEVPKAEMPKALPEVAKPPAKAAAPTGVVEPKAEPPKAVQDVAKPAAKAAVQAAAKAPEAKTPKVQPVVAPPDTPELALHQFSAEVDGAANCIRYMLGLVGFLLLAGWVAYAVAIHRARSDYL